MTKKTFHKHSNYATSLKYCLGHADGCYNANNYWYLNIYEHDEFHECLKIDLSIKEESKVANRDWVDYQACSLLQYINIIANLFIMGNYFNELH